MAITPTVETKHEKREVPPGQRHVFKRAASVEKENAVGYLFLAPWLLGLLVFTIGPVLASLYLSFTNYDLIDMPAFVGLKNYAAMFQDPNWRDAVGVTFRYVFLSVPLKLTFALLLAMLLKQGLKGLGLFRAIYYIPSLLGSSVAIALLWRRIFAGDGIVNQVLGIVGIHTSFSWISSPDTFLWTPYSLWTLVILSVWQFGSPMLIFLAGLKQIPQEFYEAASTDGAGAMRKFFMITLPMITPLIFFNMLLQMVGAFQAFTPAYIVSGGSGGPINTTMFYTLYVYQQGFGQMQMGYASAMAWFLLIVIAIFSAISFWSSRYWVFYQDEKKG
jgi:multiple sugar transport system permease protein